MPFLSSNTPALPTYRLFISQLTRYAWACSSYGCFILRATRLANKGYVKERLKVSLKKFYGRYGDLIKQYEVPLSRMLNCIIYPDQIQWQPSNDKNLYQSLTFLFFPTNSICAFAKLSDNNAAPVHLYFSGTPKQLIKLSNRLLSPCREMGGIQTLYENRKYATFKFFLLSYNSKY